MAKSGIKSDIYIYEGLSVDAELVDKIYMNSRNMNDDDRTEYIFYMRAKDTISVRHIRQNLSATEVGQKLDKYTIEKYKEELFFETTLGTYAPVIRQV